MFSCFPVTIIHSPHNPYTTTQINTQLIQEHIIWFLPKTPTQDPTLHYVFAVSNFNTNPMTGEVEIIIYNMLYGSYGYVLSLISYVHKLDSCVQQSQVGCFGY